MKIIYNTADCTLKWGNNSILATNIVRNELNGARKLTEKVVRSENKDGTKGVVYMPRTFPRGTWEVYTILMKTDPYMAPEFIATDAHQLVDEWTEVDGHYGVKTGQQVEDWGYGLHNSTSSSTLGCIKIVDIKNRAKLTKDIRAAFKKKEKVILEVV